MEGTAVLGRLNWTLGEVVATRRETDRAKSITLQVPDWVGHRAGQHVDLRLTSEDGYHAERSYSIASPPEEQPRVTITVERIPTGEVSPYLTDELHEGDKLELRGPIGGYFVWESSMGGPLLLVAGGSGVVPLMAMIRHRAAARSSVATRLLYSSRSISEIIYHDELDQLVHGSENLQVVYTLTRESPAGWTGYHRRLDADMLRDVAWPPDQNPVAYICGPTPFVEAAATMLAALGHAPGRIRTERFGPTG